MKTLIAGAVALLLSSYVAAVPTIGPLQGTTALPQRSYLGTDPSNPEWFSRYADAVDDATIQAFKDAPGNENGLDLYAVEETVRVTYLGTGAARESNLFLAHSGTGSFDTSAFWAPIYASGGTNNLDIYTPVKPDNFLFQTRSACSFEDAKDGNTCKIDQIGKYREIMGLSIGENLVFGLQTLPLIYHGGGSDIDLPNANYFFTGRAVNNSDAQGWADSVFHTKVMNVGTNAYLVGFEDTWLGEGSTSDRDYNDMVFLFQGVTAIPEPDSVLLLMGGAGMMATVIARRRRRVLTV